MILTMANIHEQWRNLRCCYMHCYTDHAQPRCSEGAPAVRMKIKSLDHILVAIATEVPNRFSTGSIRTARHVATRGNHGAQEPVLADRPALP